MLLEALLIGGTIYATTRTYQQLKHRRWRPQSQRGVAAPANKAIATLFGTTTTNLALHQANQSLVLSSAALGLATAGLIWMAPILTVASIPPMLYVFLPTFQAAWRTVRQERRVNNPVLDTMRITVCVVMGYSFVAALNACLQAISQKHFLQAEVNFQRQLRMLFGTEQPMVWCYINGVEVQLPVSEIPLGAIIVVTTGEVVPVAGLVVYGNGRLNQRFSTGAAGTVYRQRGERVEAGAIVQAGELYLQVEQVEQRLMTTVVRELLVESVEQQTIVEQAGAKGADRMAPQMLLTFALTLPLLGANHAAAFLTTSFGNHLRTLGPYTVRNFLIPAAEQGIVIKVARALELANLVNVLIFDQNVLADPVARAHAKAVIHALRQRPRLLQRLTAHEFAIYHFVAAGDEAYGQQLTAELGLDDYFVATSTAARTAVIERLQLSGRVVAYVGDGQADAPAMTKAQVSIGWQGIATLPTNQAQVVLLGGDLRPLLTFFELAATFAAKQGFNLFVPIGLDLVDIGTTILLGFDLGYSILFTYSGLLLGAGYAHLRPRAKRIAAQPDMTPAPTHALPLLTGASS